MFSIYEEITSQCRIFVFNILWWCHNSKFGQLSNGYDDFIHRSQPIKTFELFSINNKSLYWFVYEFLSDKRKFIQGQYLAFLPGWRRNNMWNNQNRNQNISNQNRKQQIYLKVPKSNDWRSTDNYLYYGPETIPNI